MSTTKTIFLLSLVLVGDFLFVQRADAPSKQIPPNCRAIASSDPTVVEFWCPPYAPGDKYTVGEAKFPRFDFDYNPVPEALRGPSIGEPPQGYPGPIGPTEARK